MNEARWNKLPGLDKEETLMYDIDLNKQHNISYVTNQYYLFLYLSQGVPLLELKIN